MPFRTFKEENTSFNVTCIHKLGFINVIILSHLASFFRVSQNFYLKLRSISKLFSFFSFQAFSSNLLVPVSNHLSKLEVALSDIFNFNVFE